MLKQHVHIVVVIIILVILVIVIVVITVCWMGALVFINVRIFVVVVTKGVAWHGPAGCSVPARARRAVAVGLIARGRSAEGIVEDGAGRNAVHENDAPPSGCRTVHRIVVAPVTRPAVVGVVIVEGEETLVGAHREATYKWARREDGLLWARRATAQHTRHKTKIHCMSAHQSKMTNRHVQRSLLHGKTRGTYGQTRGSARSASARGTAGGGRQPPSVTACSSI